MIIGIVQLEDDWVGELRSGEEVWKHGYDFSLRVRKKKDSDQIMIPDEIHEVTD